MRRPFSFACLGAASVAACLVPDVELVASLPGGGGSGGSVSRAGEGAAGEPTPSEGGAPSAAGSEAGGAGASAGTDSGGAPGGSGGAAGGSAGNGGSGGSPPVQWRFGEKGACDVEAPLFCDDFEVQRTSNWGAGPLWQRPELDDSPSPTRVMDTAFKDAPMAFVKPAGNFNVSFWVRFPSLTDQHFITWPLADGNLSFGLEESSFRFRLDSDPVTIAPELPKHTRGATVDTWTCVDIDWVADGEFEATVTVFGEPPLELAPLGGSPTPGEDEKLLQAIPGATLTLGDTSWTLGQVGVELQIDDVRVVTGDEPSVCDDFVAANQ